MRVYVVGRKRETRKTFLMKYNKYATERGAIMVPFITRESRAFCRDSTPSAASLASAIALARTFRRLASRLSLSCFHGARRNIRQCRGVLAKLSVALGRLRFTQSRLVSPACRFACSLATWIPLRVLDVGLARLWYSPNDWGELEGRKRKEREALHRTRVRRRRKGMRAVRERERSIPRKATTSETPQRASRRAPNRSLRLPRLTAPVLSTRGDRDRSHSRSAL